MNNGKPEICIVDDHVLLRKGLANLISNFGDYSVLFEADNGRDFLTKLNPSHIPDIVLLDINMPVMDGYETSSWLRLHYPDIKILTLSMYDSDRMIIRMLKNGVKGYLLKDSEAIELKLALDAIWHTGYYYSEMISGKLVRASQHPEGAGKESLILASLSEREMIFLRLICTELSYKEIADHLLVSPRTIDGYRDALFEKFGVRTRVGLVLYAIKNGLADA